MPGRDSGASAGRRTNLPAQLTSFVARESERREVKRLIAGARLLTLAGTGGVGKTRLALKVAGELIDKHADGVWLVELSSLSDGGLVAQAVASALGVAESPGEPLLATLTSALAERRSLVILDNCEHLVAACAELAFHLLSACPSLRMLTTSREPLGVPGELVWRVPPLPVPDPGVAIGTDEIAGSAAVALFVDRARQVLPMFTIGDRNAAQVAEICRRLDGIPLAIELAAARLRSLGVAEIAERLDDHARLLTTGPRTVHPRHQTMRATVDWSYELLGEADRRTLRHLAVFAGGWSLEAAESVVGWWGEVTTAADGDVLEQLTRLVDRSLVQVDHQRDRARYRLLETIRQFADEKLATTEERAALRERHCACYLALAEQAGPALRGPDQVSWVERLDFEHDNLRAALNWTIAVGDHERGLRLGRALWRFWSYRGNLTEGRRRLDAVLAIAAAPAITRSAALAEVQFAAGRLAHQQADCVAARAHYEAALAIAEAVGEHEIILGSLTQLGHLETDDGAFGAAREWYRRALAHRHEVGDGGEVAVALAGLAYVSQVEGALDASRELIEEGLAIVERIGDRSLRAYLLCRLGDVAVDKGTFQEALAALEAGLRGYQVLGARSRLPLVLESFARLAAARGAAAQALRIGGASAALREAVTALPTPRESTWFARGLEPARRLLGARASEVAWAGGRALTLEQALAEAMAGAGREQERFDRAQRVSRRLRALDPPAIPSVGVLASSQPLVDPLTPREREVVALVARGLTNRQIGEALVITEGTATLHVKHVLSKLGFASRAQIAAWAVHQRLTEPAALAVDPA